MKTSLPRNNRKRNDRGDRSHARISSITFPLLRASHQRGRRQSAANEEFREFPTVNGAVIRGEGTSRDQTTIARACARDFLRNVACTYTESYNDKYQNRYAPEQFLLSINIHISLYFLSLYIFN